MYDSLRDGTAALWAGVNDLFTHSKSKDLGKDRGLLGCVSLLAKASARNNGTGIYFLERNHSGLGKPRLV